MLIQLYLLLPSMLIHSEYKFPDLLECGPVCLGSWLSMRVTCYGIIKPLTSFCRYEAKEFLQEPDLSSAMSLSSEWLWNITASTTKFRLLFQLSSIFPHKVYQTYHHIYKWRHSQTINNVFYKAGMTTESIPLSHHLHLGDDYTLQIERPCIPRHVVRKTVLVHRKVERIQDIRLWTCFSLYGKSLAQASS